MHFQPDFLPAAPVGAAAKMAARDSAAAALASVPAAGFHAISNRAPYARGMSSDGALATAGPSARTLFRRGLDGETGRPPAAIAQREQMHRHHALIERMEEILCEQGPHARGALAQRVVQRPAWVPTVALFERAVSNRAVRDAWRSEQRAWSSPRQQPAASPSPRSVTAALSHELTAPAQPALRARTPLQVGVLALYGLAHGQGAAASEDAQSQLLDGVQAGRTLVAYPRLAVAAGASLVATAATACLATQCWRERDAQSAAALPIAGSKVETALKAIRYLDSHQASDGENLLQGLLWRDAGRDAAEPSVLDQALALRGAELDRWLAAELDAEQKRDSAPDMRLRTVRSAAHTASARQRRNAPCSVQVAQCRAIQPRTQTLAAVEASINQLLGGATLQAVLDEDLAAFSGCLVKIRHGVQHKRSQLQADGQRLEASSVLPEVRQLRRVALMQLIDRARAVEQQVNTALVGLNTRILGRVG